MHAPLRSALVFDMPQRNGSGAPNSGAPDNWFHIVPAVRGNNAHPLTPSGATRELPLASLAFAALGTRTQRLLQSGNKSAHGNSGSDSLGLARAADPMRMLLRETRVKEQLQRAADTSNSNSNSSTARPSASSAGLRGDRVPQLAARSSPRHLKLLRTHTARDAHDVSEAFSPQRSLRLARLCKQPDVAPTRSTATPRDDDASQSALSTHTPSLPLVPLHELIQTVDDAVDADPRAASGQAALTHAFMEQWLAQHDASRHAFKSVAVHAEVGLRELARLTANVPRPNEVTTAFVCKVLQDVASHCGAYASLLDVLRAELHLAIYARDAHDPPVPYFAVVKHQKQLVRALQRDKTLRRARNERLAHEIVQVHSLFRRVLDTSATGLVRTRFREWYAIAVVRKKNSKKYIEYYSAWFTGSAKALVPKLFAAWKQSVAQHKLDALQAELRVASDNLATLQQQVDALHIQRDGAHNESLAVQTDCEQVEGCIERQRLTIESASAYLESSASREGIVCHEGQLRAEAVSLLPPLVLESLLRAYHNVGFLQQVDSEFMPRQQSAAVDCQPALTKDGDPTPDNSSASTGDLAPHMTAAAAADTLAARLKSHNQHSVLQMCLAEITKLRGTVLPNAASSVQPPVPPELSMQRFGRLFQSIQQRMTAKGVNVIFASLATHRTINDQVDDSVCDCTNNDGSNNNAQQLQATAQAIASAYEQTLVAIRAQDEHYARSSKLFSARMLESHEVTVVPTHVTASPLLPAAAATNRSDDDRSPTRAESPLDTSQLGTTPVSMLVLESCDLGVINGVQRFAIPNVCPIQQTPLQLDDTLALAATEYKSRATYCATDAPSNAALEQLALMCASDFAISPRHARAFFTLFVAHLASEFGSLLFSPADMSAFVHNAYVLETPAANANVAALSSSTSAAIFANNIRKNVENSNKNVDNNDVDKSNVDDNKNHCTTLEHTRDQGFRNIVAAYDVWNRLAAQMIDAEIVQSRGGTNLLTDRPGTVDIITAAAHHTSLTNSSGVVGIRPKLQHYIEPLPQGVLMTAAAKERESTSRSGRRNSSSHGARRSVSDPRPLGETFDTARIRRLSLDDTALLTQCIENVHRVVETTSARIEDFNGVRQQIRELRHVQWEQASELASQFTDCAFEPLPLSSISRSMAATATAGPTTTGMHDERKHVFECVTFANPVIERIFSVEADPEDELARVRQTLERTKHVVRRLYTTCRPQIQHAMSLDELWHVVKALRFPKPVHMLPALRDVDDSDLATTMHSSGSSFEQLFSPDDLAELLLQLCNEQFLPQITPLSARVEHFAAHYLPLAVQHQSILRNVMHEPDVKHALAEHAPTLRIIFRRYCTKDRDVRSVSSSQQSHRHSVVGDSSSSANATATTARTSHRSVRHTAGHGIAKYVRLNDWLAFIHDYNLVRPRFSLAYGATVFRTVQDVAPSGDSDDEQLAMLFSEFCEALVSVATSFFPDPFVPIATKVRQFVQRFLPVAPDDVASHAFV